MALRLLLALALLPGCAVQGLDFVRDTRVEVVSPEQRSRVTLPVTVAWEARDFDGTFAVLVNRSPQPPGEPLDWHVRDDRTCLAAPGCPDDDWYTQRGIHTTTDTSLELNALPDRGVRGRRELHEVTVILLDTHGRRIGESAFAVTFEVDRGRG